MSQGNRRSPGEAIDAGWKGIEAVRAKKLQPHDTVREVASFIVATEEGDNSEFVLVDGQPYLIDRCALELYPISLKDLGFRAWLGARYGLLAPDGLTKNVSAFLEAYTKQHGRPILGRRFAYWDDAGQQLYVSRGDGTVWRLDGNNEIQVEPNGLGPVVFFDEGSDPIEADIGPHKLLAPMLVDDLNYARETSGDLTPDHQRLLFLTWIFAVGFADKFPAKPILLVDGEEGSGKTLAIQRVQRMFTGASIPMHVGQKDEEDFPVMLLSQAPIAFIDNQDSAIEWLRDAIAMYTTAGGWIKRQFYTRLQSVKIFPQAFPAISTRSPATFRRPDIADRCFIIRLERRARQGSADQILRAVTERRPQLLGEWLWHINRLIHLSKTVELPTEFVYRNVDFARFVYLTTRTLELPDEAAVSLLSAAQTEREALIIEDEPLLDLLEEWLNTGQNNGRELTATELCDELHSIAITKPTGGKFTYTAWSLSRRLQTLAGAWRSSVTITKRRLKGRVLWVLRKVKGDA